MPLARTDFANLNYFLAVARHRSFSRAGVELGLTSSTLSHALRAFEQRLGIRLLNRTTRNVIPASRDRARIVRNTRSTAGRTGTSPGPVPDSVPQ